MQSIARRSAFSAVVVLMVLALESCSGGSGGASSSSALPVVPAMPAANSATLRPSAGPPKVTIKEIAVPSNTGNLIGGIVATKSGVYLAENGFYNPTADLGVRYISGTFQTMISYDPNFQGPPTGAIGATADGTVYVADVDGPLYYDYPVPNPGLTSYFSGTATPNSFLHIRLSGTVSDMAGDSKGNLWYGVTPNIGGESATVFSFSTQTVLNSAGSIRAVAAGRNGDAWVAGGDDNLYHISSAGAILHTYALRSGADVHGAVVDTQGAVWFTDSGHNAIGRLGRTGTLTQFHIPTASSNVDRITLGSDGAMWFTEAGANKIGRITTLGHIHEYKVPTSNSGPTGISSLGPGCNPNVVWFVEQNAGKLGEILIR